MGPFTHRYVRAHNLVTLHYSDDQTDYPIDYQFWKAVNVEALESALDAQGVFINPTKRANKADLGKKWRHYLLDRYSVYQYKKPALQQTYKTKLHLGLEMFEAFCGQYPDLRLPFCFDSWFTQPDYCRYIDKNTQKNLCRGTQSEQKNPTGRWLFSRSECFCC